MHDGVHMETKEYLPRIVDKKLSQYLKIFGAVCIEGPKWCGKTWTSQYHSKSKVFIGNPEGDFQNRRLAEILTCTHVIGPKIILDCLFPETQWRQAV